MPKGISFEEKKKIILNFLKKHKKSYSQGELAEKFYEDLFYTNVLSAKISIGIMLKELHKEKKVSFIEKKPLRGSIPKKMWYAYGNLP